MEYVEHRGEVEFTGLRESCHAVVVSAPVEKKRSLKSTVFLTDGRLSGRYSYAYFPTSGESRQLRPGDGIAMSSRFDPPSVNNSMWRGRRSGHFDYSRWLKVNGIAARTYVDNAHWRYESVGMESLPMMQRMTLHLSGARASFLNMLSRCGISGQSYALVAAMVVGDRSALTSEMRDTYSASGVSHILALSGMHMGIIYAILSLMLVRRRSGLLRTALGNALVVVAMWMFAMMVGMSPSVVRSAFMFSMLAMASVLERGNVSLNSLGLVAVVLLMSNPMSLWDISFQMSFLAVLGILLCNELFREKAKSVLQKRFRLVDWVWQMAKVSVAAQLAVAPLTVYYFGQIPCYFLLANFVAVPLATVVIYVAILLAVVSFVPLLPDLAPWLQEGVATLLEWLASAMNSSLGWISSLPGASIGNIDINVLQTVAIYVFFIILYAASFRVEKIARIMAMLRR